MPEVLLVVRKGDKGFVLKTPNRDWILFASSVESAEVWITKIQNKLAEFSAKPSENLRRTRTKSEIEKMRGYPVPPQRKIPPPVPARSKKANILSHVPPVPRRKRITSQKPKNTIKQTETILMELVDQQRTTENEEMKILLQSLHQERPFPHYDIKRQSELENKMSALQVQIDQCKQQLGLGEKPSSSRLSRRLSSRKFGDTR